MRESYAQSQVPADGKSSTPFPDYHKIVQGMLKHGTECVSGSVTGTGAALEVATPFDPGVVLLFNRTAACFVMKTPGMTGANAMKLSGVPALTFDADSCTLGVAAGKGFTIGPDADINSAAEEIEWVAFGFRDAGSL